jgi:hypothetical protein
MIRIPYHIILIVLGFLVLAFIFLGVPVLWKDILLVGISLFIIVLGIAFYYELRAFERVENDDSDNDAFQDSMGPQVLYEETVITEYSDGGGNFDQGDRLIIENLDEEDILQ